ncbi:hypothetical protein ACFWTC_35020 [Streptomyces sp. NPDC058619]|uniref:hypothetical protein n=1 Tax=unclassified Streptomyces TaxID=2593676 RepID=UPI00365D7236
MKLARFATATALTAGLAGAAVAPAMAQQHSLASGPHSYTCSHQGGGPNHTVNCSGLITVNNVLNGTTVNIGDVNVLTGTRARPLTRVPP